MRAASHALPAGDFRMRFRILLIVAIASLLAAPGWAAETTVRVGILPVYDTSAAPVSEQMAPYLTFFTYQSLLKSPHVTPVLLSPGGLYDPDGTDWIESYAAKANVDVVLIARLMPPIEVKNNTVKIDLEVELYDLASGKRAPKQSNTSMQVGGAFYGFSLTTRDAFHDFAGNPVEFARQPLGKTTLKLADWLRDYTLTAISTLSVKGGETPATEPSGSCSVNVRIRYLTRNAASRSYSLLAEDKDETPTIKDGVATFTIASGPAVLRFAVNDAPYRLPTEKLYQSSTTVQCSQEHKTLVFEIGSAGEALSHWE